MFVFPPQLRSAEEAGQKKSWADASDSAVVEKLQQMEKDRVEQEMLIKGYQQVCLPRCLSLHCWYVFLSVISVCPYF